MQIVLQPNDLLLSRPVFDGASVIAGYVENGGWFFRTNGTIDLAYYAENSDLLNPVTHFRATVGKTFKIVPEGEALKLPYWDYNARMQLVDNEEVFDETAQDLCDLQDISEIARLNRIKLVEASFDDDIPF